MPPDVVLDTQFRGLTPFIRGKVRDVYDLGEHLLLVATDRISAYDVILPNGIPDKGRVLTQLSEFWFRRFGNLCPNHCVTTDAAQIREACPAAPVEQMAGRAMLVRKTRAFPVECVVRGYLDGSAWKEYRQAGEVCGIPLPAGLQQGSRLQEPIFTPATKAHSGHDINIPQVEMFRLVGEAQGRRLIELSIAVYSAAAEYARGRGILIADTKFEFGLLDGEPLMIDECLTPDSSRFWDADGYRPGGAQPSFDKQFVRDYLDQSGWNHDPPAPSLPDEVVGRTADKYREIFTRLTGRELSAGSGAL